MNLLVLNNNEAETEPVQNGLTDWIKIDSAATVVNKVDGWIRESLSKNPELKNTQVLENEYLSDQGTRAFSKLVSDDSSKPDGFGLEAHQFNSDHPTLNENDPLLSIANQINNRQVGGVKSGAESRWWRCAVYSLNRMSKIDTYYVGCPR